MSLGEFSAGLFERASLREQVLGGTSCVSSETASYDSKVTVILKLVACSVAVAEKGRVPDTGR